MVDRLVLGFFSVLFELAVVALRWRKRKADTGNA